MDHHPLPVLGTTVDRRSEASLWVAPTVAGFADASVMVLMLALAEVQYVRRGRLPARLPATRLALLERSLRSELCRRGLEVAERPRVSATRATLRLP